MATTTTLGVLLLLLRTASAYVAGFIKSPLSEVKIIEESIELHCVVIGKPTPEIQWWSVEVNDTKVMSQLYDGARQQRVNIHFTYNLDAKSTISITNLSIEDTGTYECRASNDPYRNDLKKSPKAKWIRSQATVIVIEHPIIIKNLQILNPAENVKEAILSCNLTDPPSFIEGRVWRKDDIEISATKDSDSSPLMEYKLDAVDAKHSGAYTCHYFTTPSVNDTILVKAPPGVNIDKKSEHGNEGDYGVMVCRSSGYPPVENWIWSRQTNTGTELLVNGTKNIAIKNMGNKTELRIFPLNIEEDQGDYFCNATNEIGARVETIHFRVRGRFAAVWPFLGIVAEVIVLVAIIFIYEKRRKPDEISDDDEQGSAPLKSNSSTNHKDKNIRQRNSN
ncbi:basigin isoform X1 [Narcine bancroftii]|uniref:basigin isoform X1 n=1 Tax=Narcine bancroftii TaxID=1343680 RepID=UPI00383184D2